MEIGGCCINATLRDYARFGQLFLDEGRVGNEQVLPREWVQVATRPDPERPFLHAGHVDPASFGGKLGLGYQYNWWLWPEDGAYSAIGHGGQWIYVNPVARIVIVQSAVWEPGAAGKGYAETQAVFRAIVNAMR
jgi:CubicO group peptidase (beta-lactamase class C family)